MPRHHMVEVLLENYLSILVLGLKVATNNGYEALIHPIVYVVRHGGPTSDLLDMVRHNPSILEITAKFHLPN